MSVSAYGQDVANRRDQWGQKAFTHHYLGKGMAVWMVCQDCPAKLRAQFHFEADEFFEIHDGHKTMVSV